MKLRDRHRAYLERVARQMTRHFGKSVSARDVHDALLDLALQDEGVFDPEDLGKPVSPLRREIIQAERGARTVDLAPHELLSTVLGSQ